MTGIESAIAHYGYLALAGLVFAEDLGLPVPGETAVIAAGAAAAAGDLNPFVAAAVTAVAAILGDNGAYAIGRYGGRRLLLRVGGRVGITPTKLAEAEEFFDRWGGPGIAVARFITFVRVVAGLVAGAVEMRWARFAVWQSIGAVLWASAMTAVGYYGLAEARRLLVLAEQNLAVKWALGIAVTALLSVALIRFAARREEHATGGESVSAEEDEPSERQ